MGSNMKTNPDIERLVQEVKAEMIRDRLTPKLQRQEIDAARKRRNIRKTLGTWR